MIKKLEEEKAPIVERLSAFGYKLYFDQNVKTNTQVISNGETIE